MSPTHTTEALAAGHTLRRARELAGLRERSAARSLGVPRSQLRAWESGAAAPDADELARAIALYSADLDQIWPDRRPLISDDEPGVLVVGDERIDLGADPELTPDGVTVADGPIGNRVVLSRYLAAVRRQRQLAPSDPVELRSADIASLSHVLDLDDDALEAELAELLDLTPAGARWTARALVVGGLMAVGATAMVGTSWFAPVTDAGAAPSSSAPAAAAVTFAPEVAGAAPSDRAEVLFAPATVDPDAPVDAELVPGDEPAAASPFSTEPTSATVELAPAVFAVAPSTEWSAVPTDAPTTPPELPAG